MAKTAKFAALSEFRQTQLDTPATADLPKTADTPRPPYEPGRGRGRPAGKRSNPEFEPTTVLLRKQTKKTAGRMLEDTESSQDLSDLIEQLLGDWISRHL